MSSLSEIVDLLPRPALSCLIGAISNSTCALTDVQCICADEYLNAQATTCVRANSTVRETLLTKNLTNTLCGIEPESHGSTAVVILCFMSLASITVILRLVARSMNDAAFWWDDACNMLALMCSIGVTAISLMVRDLGVGHDIWTIPPDNVTELLRLLYISFVLYAASRWFIRLSLILFLMRIFKMAWGRSAMIFTFVLINCQSVAFVITASFLCTPVDFFWKGWDGEHSGRCINFAAFFRACALISIIIDFWQLLVPVPLIIRLNLTLKKKLLVIVMFATGTAVIIVSIIRYPKIGEFTSSENISKNTTNLGTLSAIELHIGVICACLPSIQGLFKFLRSPKNSQNLSTTEKYSSSKRSITRTTTIQQQTLNDSQTKLSCPAAPATGSDIELNSVRAGHVTARDWIE